jgi:hypothetical protein
MAVRSTFASNYQPLESAVEKRKNMIIYSTFVITVGLALAFFRQARSAIRSVKHTKIWRNRFALCVILSALFSGIPFFYGVLWLSMAAGYNPSLGHGEVLVVAPIFNLALGILLAVVGRFLLARASIKW